MALTSGTKLGPYEIQSPLGAGGMGEVYRAKDTRVDRTVAIKVLPAHLSSDPDLKQRLEREAKAISALQHANICTLYDIGTQGGAEFLVMELCILKTSRVSRIKHLEKIVVRLFRYNFGHVCLFPPSSWLDSQHVQLAHGSGP